MFRWTESHAGLVHLLWRKDEMPAYTLEADRSGKVLPADRSDRLIGMAAVVGNIGRAPAAQPAKKMEGTTSKR